MLENSELVVRAALLPRMVVSGVISPAKVVADLKKEPDPDGAVKWTLSLGSETLLPTNARKHDFGCRVALSANNENQSKSDAGLGSYEQIFYRGCFRMTVQGIHNAGTTMFSLEVHHRPLPNLDEHCDIEMRRTDVAGTKGEISTDRTRVIARLRGLLFDPSEHICPCDLAFSEMIEPIKLSLN